MGWVIGGLLSLVLGPLAYVAWVLRWQDRETSGDAYFARTLAGRHALKERIRERSRWVIPISRIIAAIVRPKRLPTCEFEGVTGPAFACTKRSFRDTAGFVPDGADIFVATQMKCGTTWMQQVVYEVLSRGRGDLSDEGHRHMYATSPWIESRQSVSLGAAPRLGDRKQRLIKTHMPTRLCPYSASARYLYVLRHPVACFTSTRDFVTMLSGPFVPSTNHLLDWYCSDRMFWRSWPEHADGWWRWAQERPNVLFVHYEEMLEDLPAVVLRVARFLETELTGEEIATVARKSSFAYMKAHEDVFEMSPPSVLTLSGEFLKSGTRSREHDLEPADRERILSFCRERLADSSYPAARFYPDLGPETL